MAVEPFNQFVFFGLFNLMRVQKNVNKHPTGPVFAALALRFSRPSPLLSKIPGKGSLVGLARGMATRTIRDLLAVCNLKMSCGSGIFVYVGYRTKKPTGELE